MGSPLAEWLTWRYCAWPFLPGQPSPLRRDDRAPGTRAGARVEQTLSWLYGQLQGSYYIALYRGSGNQAGQASALNNADTAHIMLGDPQQGRTNCQQALAIHESPATSTARRTHGTASATPNTTSATWPWGARCSRHSH